MNPLPTEEVIEKVEELELEYEMDRAWVWITTDLAPMHKKCECVECVARKAMREQIKAIGFRFAMAPHTLPSGQTSRWGHSCLSPTRNKRRSKGGSTEETTTTSEPVSDDALLAMLA